MRSERHGFALVGALLAIVCISAMVAGLAFVTRQDLTLSAGARRSHQAFLAAELAAWSAVADLDSTVMEAERGRELPFAAVSHGADTVNAFGVRLSETVYMAVGEAAVRSIGGALLWRRVAVLLHLARDSLGVSSFVPLPGRAWAEPP